MTTSPVNRNKLWLENEETAHSRIEQARNLKSVAAESGMRFNAYLPPDLAKWVLNQVENGMFIDPSEAVFCFIKQAKELAPHSDLKEELLRRQLAEAAKGKPIPLEEVEARMEEKRERYKTAPKPARWQKIKQPEASG